MSNGDDILDNWEEIDESVLNSPAQKLETSSAPTCDRITKETSAATISPTTTTSSSRPNQMKVLQRSDTQESVTKTSKSPLDDMSATFQPVMMVLHKPQDEYQSANYTAPIANQTVKILRRPTQSTEIRNNGVRRQPIKTLQQREQEYAEARLRILGSAINPEDLGETIPIPPVGTMNNTTPSPSTTTSAPKLTNKSSANSTIVKTHSSNVEDRNQYINQYLQQQRVYQQHYPIQQQQQHHPLQQQPQNYFQNQQQQQPHSPVYNKNSSYNMNSLLAHGPMGALGQSAQYQTVPLASPKTQQQQLKYQQYHQNSPQQPHKTQQQPQQTWSPVVGGSVSTSSIRQQQNDTILRLPRGPDGTTGFQIHR